METKIKSDDKVTSRQNSRDAENEVIKYFLVRDECHQILIEFQSNEEPREPKNEFSAEFQSNVISSENLELLDYEEFEFINMNFSSDSENTEKLTENIDVDNIQIEIEIANIKNHNEDEITGNDEEDATREQIEDNVSAIYFVFYH